MKASIDCSGQFGGRDAHKVALPHWKALKSAGKATGVRSFPLPELHYVLRIDGEIQQYGPSGVGPVLVDKDRTCVSVDIQCTRADHPRIREVITGAIRDTPAALLGTRSKRFKEMDLDALARDLEAFEQSYRDSLAESE